MFTFFRAFKAVVVVFVCSYVSLYPNSLLLIEHDQSGQPIQQKLFPIDSCRFMGECFPEVCDEFQGSIDNNFCIHVDIKSVCPYPELNDTLSHFEQAECILDALIGCYNHAFNYEAGITPKEFNSSSDHYLNLLYYNDFIKSIIPTALERLGAKSLINMVIAADFLNLFQEIREYRSISFVQKMATSSFQDKMPQVLFEDFQNYLPFYLYRKVNKEVWTKECIQRKKYNGYDDYIKNRKQFINEYYR